MRCLLFQTLITMYYTVARRIRFCRALYFRHPLAKARRNNLILLYLLKRWAIRDSVSAALRRSRNF